MLAQADPWDLAALCVMRYEMEFGVADTNRDHETIRRALGGSNEPLCAPDPLVVALDRACRLVRAGDADEARRLSQDGGFTEAYELDLEIAIREITLGNYTSAQRVLYHRKSDRLHSPYYFAYLAHGLSSVGLAASASKCLRRAVLIEPGLRNWTPNYPSAPKSAALDKPDVAEYALKLLAGECL